MLRVQESGGKHAVLLTGPPGVGKTTVARRVALAVREAGARSFTTAEIRVRGERQGFRLETLDARSAVLARAGRASPHRVGRYAVDLEALDRIVENALGLEPRARAYVVDEIGKMVLAWMDRD